MAHRDEDPIPELERQLAQLVVQRLEQLVRFVTRVDGTVRITVEWSTRRAALFAVARKR